MEKIPLIAIVGPTAVGKTALSIELAKEFNTPLYVMDQELIETTIDKMKEAFKSSRFGTQIAYAGKAFLTTGMAKLVEKKGLELDVVSGGELYTAYKAGFPMNRVHMHGNNKTYEELEMAIDFGIKQIVIDNEDEIEKLENYIVFLRLILRRTN